MTTTTARPHCFQTFWSGSPLSPYECFALRSFIDHGHAVDLYTYDHDLAVPDGVVRRDAADILPEDQVFASEHDGFGHGSVVSFSDVFRYRLLRDHGGWWVDADVVCLTSAIEHAGGQYFARQDDDLINCATMYFEPGALIPTICLDRALAMGHGARWGDTGPGNLTDVLTELGLLAQAAAPSDCYPVHFTEAIDLLRPSRAAELHGRIVGATFLHVWNSTLVHAGIDKFLLPPAGSLLRVIADRHPVEGWLGEYDEHRLEHDVERAAEEQSVAEGFRTLRREQSQLTHDLHRARAELDATMRRLDEVTGSISWRITRPLRRAAALQRRLRGKP